MGCSWRSLEALLTGKDYLKVITRTAVMISKQTNHMAQFFTSVTEEVSKPGRDPTTIRDIYEKLHLAATEPEGVSYAEVDVDGVPALWFMPKGCDANRVLLHSRLLDAPRPEGRWTHRQGRRKPRTRVGLPPFTGIQVPGSDRGRGEGVSLAARSQHSSGKYCNHRSVYRREFCRELGFGAAQQASRDAGRHPVRWRHGTTWS